MADELSFVEDLDFGARFGSRFCISVRIDLKMSETDSRMLRVDSTGEIIDVKDAEKPTKGSFGDLNGQQEDIGRFSERIDATYPADCYSFLTLHGPFEKPLFFGFGILVWLFQVGNETTTGLSCPL